MDKIIITVVGKDTVGIVARTCSYLAENNVNILDITQTILKEYFNMMMIVNIEKAVKPFEEIAKEMEVLGESIGVTMLCQREEIFTSMHRI